MAKQNRTITTLEELPAILNAEHIAQVTGLSKPVVYGLLNSKGFPVVKVGKRLLVPKQAFEAWLTEQSGYCAAN